MSRLQGTLFLCLWINLFSYGYAQERRPRPVVSENGRQQVAGQMNAVKMNVLALPFRSFSFQYERVAAKRISVALGVAIIPRGSFPWLGSFKSIIGDEKTFNELKQARVGGVAITAAPRFYVGKHGGLRGFYIAPYLRYSTYGLNADQFEYEVTVETEFGTLHDTRHIPLTGRINSFTGGVLFGAQWRIASRLTLDWWILGAAYGGATGNLTGTATLSPEEQEGLREELNELEIPMVKTTAMVDANGGRLHLKGPWAGIRSGVAIGFLF